MHLARPRLSDEIPTASMADVAFLLLVFFLVTSTLAIPRGLDFGLPPEEETPQAIEPVESVLVEVQGNGVLLVDGRRMALGGLLAYLAPRLATNPQKPVIVHTLPGTPYGATVDVLDELRQGGERLGLGHDIVIALPSARERAAWTL